MLVCLGVKQCQGCFYGHFPFSKEFNFLGHYSGGSNRCSGHLYWTIWSCVTSSLEWDRWYSWDQKTWDGTAARYAASEGPGPQPHVPLPWAMTFPMTVSQPHGLELSVLVQPENTMAWEGEPLPPLSKVTAWHIYTVDHTWVWVVIFLSWPLTNTTGPCENLANSPKSR